MIGVNRMKNDAPRSIGKLPYFFTLIGFIAVLLIFGIISMIAPKQTVSQIENRPLEVAPRFSAKALASGDFTDAFSLYYSDTFPMRELMIETASELRSLYGIKGEDEAEIHFGKGTAEGVDGNAPVDDDVENNPNVTGDDAITGDGTAPPTYAMATPSGVNNPPGEVPAKGETEAKETPDKSANANGDVQGGLIVIGDAALEFYGFSKSVNEDYAKVINKFDDKYKGKLLTNVMVVPTNVEFKLPDKYKELTRPQDDAIDFIYDHLNDDISKVNVYNTLKSHADEYIYFRTDHHWTALGAFYAYRDFCLSREMLYAPLANYSEIRLDGFLGSFYNAVGGNKKMKKNPDYVIAYPPVTPYEMAGYQGSDGKSGKMELSLVRDAKEIPGQNKYLAFSGGDLPFIHIKTEANTGKKLIIFKESYANAFIPFLTNNYDEICVVDFRYFTGDVGSLIKKYDINEALFINYISAAGSSRQVTLLSNMLK
jgi:hypothetical protein